MAVQRGVLLDRDGTLVYPRHYPSRPDELQLYPGLAPELRLLQLAGFRLVVVTNQGGLAHGLFSPTALDAMHAHLQAQLHGQGVTLDGIYYCPHHPAGSIPELAVECTCRKPQPGMLLRAAAELDLDLEQSWFVGDILDDIEAGRRASCRTLLVDLGTESLPGTELRTPHFVARTTVHALQIIAAVEQLGDPVELDYLPPSWQWSTVHEQDHAY
ncbi:MAG: HAD family hydrolase [Herpetosiphonaceae bacterium]|nr:HAD family hydrolase [Herpetosiphonaceae bacterium]